MKRFPCVFGAVLLLVAGRLPAEDLAVFGKNEIVVVTAQASGALPAEAGPRAFLAAFRERLGTGKPFAERAALVNPPAWGKTISPATHGEVACEKTFRGGFVGRLTLSGLAPRHRYILTLNGRPDLPGNALLPTPVPGLADERYYDFLFIESDAAGAYAATLGIALASGDYQPRIYVKDADDFKIVLYRDYFPFTVE